MEESQCLICLDEADDRSGNPTADLKPCPLRFAVRQRADRGAGEAQTGAPFFGVVRAGEIFLQRRVWLVVSAADCGGNEPPIPAVIPIQLAALSSPDSCSDPDPIACLFRP